VQGRTNTTKIELRNIIMTFMCLCCVNNNPINLFLVVCFIDRFGKQMNWRKLIKDLSGLEKQENQSLRSGMLESRILTLHLF